MRKPIGITLISLGLAAFAASCATTKTKLASVPPPPVPAAQSEPAKPMERSAASAPAPVQPVAKPTPPKAAQAEDKSAGPHINAAGLAIIKADEGVHLTAYDSNGQWLIGYGHAKGVKAGMTISAAQAERYLKEDLAVCEASVDDAVSAPVTANEFSAMVSLCYNIGVGKFKSSSLVKHVNNGEELAAADAFLDWSKATIKGERTVMPHLLERRQKERALFLDGIKAPRA